MSKYDDLIPVGLNKELDHMEDLPSIKTMIHKPMKEKEKVLEYMKNAEHIGYMPGIARDVFHPEIWTTDLSLMSDGKYQWRSDIIYYVEKYDMELPEEFVEHALRQMKKAENNG